MTKHSSRLLAATAIVCTLTCGLADGSVPNIGADAAARRAARKAVFPDGVHHIRNEDRFEDSVTDPVVTAVAVISKRHRTQQAKRLLQAMGEAAHGLAKRVKLAAIYLEDAKAVGYEFAIRSRKTPKILLFSTRSRTADELEVVARTDDEEAWSKGGGAFGTAEALVSAIIAKVEETKCGLNDAGQYVKKTLAIGGGGEL
jgi:hypothetical protein